MTAEALTLDLGLAAGDLGPAVPPPEITPTSVDRPMVVDVPAAGYRCRCGTCEPDPDSWIAQYRRTATT